MVIGIAAAALVLLTVVVLVRRMVRSRNWQNAIDEAVSRGME